MQRPRLLKSTGFRFALLHTLVFVIAVCLIGWAAEVTITSALEQQARDRVEMEAASLTTEYQQHGLTGLRSTIERRSSGAKRRLQYAILDAQKHAIAGDGYLADFAGAASAGAQLVSRSTGENATDNILVATRPLSQGMQLVVADNLESIEDVSDVVLNAFLVALALAIVIGLGSGALFTRSLLRRVDGVTRTAEAIIGGDLSHRIVLTGSGDDFDRLAATLNTMLDRIADLLENLRQISNDIAHDLRTPLARLRQGLEDAKLRATTKEDHERAINHAIEEADNLLQIFSALLRVAQIEAGAQRSSFRGVDLSGVMRTVAEAYVPVAEDCGRALQIDIIETLMVTGDRELLVQLFANLIENALRHTPIGTHIMIALRSDDEHAIAQVSDDGPGIPEEERSRIFRRFYRLEHSRTTPGSGLGLSLVAAIADLHRATIDVLDNKPGVKIMIHFRKTENALGDSSATMALSHAE